MTPRKATRAAVKTEDFEFVLTRADGESQNVQVSAPDEAEARSLVAELYPGLAFVLNEKED